MSESATAGPNVNSIIFLLKNMRNIRVRKGLPFLKIKIHLYSEPFKVECVTIFLHLFAFYCCLWNTCPSLYKYINPNLITFIYDKCFKEFQSGSKA